MEWIGVEWSGVDRKVKKQQIVKFVHGGLDVTLLETRRPD